MWDQSGRGAVVGAIVGFVSYAGNSRPGVVSIFPDLLTFLLLQALLSFVVQRQLRGRHPNGILESLLSGAAFAVPTGVVFGAVVVLVGAVRFDHPSFRLAAFGFVTAFALSLVCGALSAVSWSWLRRSTV
jgi:hypothetical protein